MTLCPIALVASCSKCPVVSYCPLKTVIGDFEQEKTLESPDSKVQDKDK